MKTFIRKLHSLRVAAPLALAMSAAMAAPLAWSGDTSSDVAEALTDTAITAQVKSKLMANSNVSGTDIEVNTDEGTVTLSGTVDSDTEKDLAYHIAKGSRGVEDVKNDISVRD